MAHGLLPLPSIPPSIDIANQWEEEMLALEQEGLRAMEQQQTHGQPEEDLMLQNLDNEFKSLIQVSSLVT